MCWKPLVHILQKPLGFESMRKKKKKNHFYGDSYQRGQSSGRAYSDGSFKNRKNQTNRKMNAASLFSNL